MSALEEPDWEILEASLDAIEERALQDVGKDTIPVIPDSVTPVEAWRTWRIVDGTLTSIYSGTVWTPGEALHAECDLPEELVWEIEPHGVTLEQAQETAMRMASTQASMVSFGGRVARMRPVPPYPRVEPPPGWGYVLKDISHDHAPAEWCRCGIYAAESFAGCPVGHVAGKVKLWGKVIPGDKGYRAEFAYPSEFHVDNHDHDQLLEQFGVPIVYKDDGSIPVGDPDSPFVAVTYPWDDVDRDRRNRRIRYAMIAAAAINLVFAVVNALNALH